MSEWSIFMYWSLDVIVLDDELAGLIERALRLNDYDF